MMCRPEHVAALASEFDSPFRIVPRWSNRSIALYDAIATLLVTEPTKQVISVGIQPDMRNRQYTLVISSNRTLGKETGRHAHDVWSKLKLYGECYHGCSNPVLGPSCREVLPERIDSFLLSIYRFSFPRLRHYLLKPCRGRTRLEVFLEFASHPSASCHAAPLFNFIAVQLYWASRGIAGHDGRELVDSKALKVFIEGVDAFYTVAERLFDDRETLTLIPQFEDAIGLDPVKFVRRLISLSVAARSLMSQVMTRLSYLVSAKDFDLQVKIVQPRNPTIKMRKSGDWVPYAGSLLDRYVNVMSLDLLPYELQPGYRLNQRFQGEVFIPGAVHPAVSVAMYLLIENRKRALDEKRSRVPAFPYIGTSRQSCLACVHFVRSLLRNGRLIFYMREDYDLRARFPWKYPNMEIAELERAESELVGLGKAERRQAEPWGKEIRSRFLGSMGRSYVVHLYGGLQHLYASNIVAAGEMQRDSSESSTNSDES